MSSPDPLPNQAVTIQSGGASALETLDSAGALAMLDDSVELYLDIANAYRQEITDLPMRVASLLQSNLADATRALHTIKGLSLTVGANMLSDVCRQCEMVLKGLQQQPLDASTRAHMVATLEQATGITLDALDQMLVKLAPPPPTPTARPASSAQLQMLVPDLQTLKGLLLQSDLQALDIYSALRERHAGTEDALQGIEQALKAFDFAKAVVQCDELIRRVGATL